MPRRTTPARATPPGPRPRGDILRQGLVAIRLLGEAPRRRGELADDLGVSLRTAQRILGAIADAGLPLEREERGREAFYSLPARR